MLERLQKILSARGIASRRKAEEYIDAGLVTVNGAVAKLGQKADPETDTIEVDGMVLLERRAMLYYLLQKPVGVVTSNVERWESGGSPSLTEGKMRAFRKRGREALPQPLKDTTVRDLLPKELQGKIYPVGRLDKESSGLLLLTNDGALANRLMHPKYDHEKEYAVTVQTDIADGQLQKLADGLVILRSRTKPATLRRLDRRNFTIALMEGKNRQIRRMVEKVGNRVVALRRIRIMTLADQKLKPGELRVLTEKERRELLKATGL